MVWNLANTEIGGEAENNNRTERRKSKVFSMAGPTLGPDKWATQLKCGAEPTQTLEAENSNRAERGNEGKKPVSIAGPLVY